MRKFWLIIAVALCVLSCDETRVYEKNEDFDEHQWMVNNKPAFEVEIEDPNTAYNIYLNIRNAVDFPYSRLFVTYYLQDSTGKILHQKLVDHMLFDPKTGEPQGTSGLGDLYDHQVPVLKSHKFPGAGLYKFQLEQFMRKDTLEGIVAVGVRVERIIPTGK